MTFQIAAIKDRVFTGENAAYSRGFMAVYRRSGETNWTPCANWISDGHGSGFNATVWCETPEAAKEAAKKWLQKRMAKKRAK